MKVPTRLTELMTKDLLRQTQLPESDYVDTQGTGSPDRTD